MIAVPEEIFSDWRIHAKIASIHRNPTGDIWQELLFRDFILTIWFFARQRQFMHSGFHIRCSNGLHSFLFMFFFSLASANLGFDPAA